MENTSPTPFVIDTADRAEWLLGKLAAIDAEADRMRANTVKRIAELDADRESLLYRFGEQLTAFCRAESDRRRRKTVTLANGSVSFRAVPERFVIADMDAATETARAVCPAALVTETVTRLDRAAFLDAARAALSGAGELLPGVELLPASESVSIKPGSKE